MPTPNGILDDLLRLPLPSDSETGRRYLDTLRINLGTNFERRDDKAINTALDTLQKRMDWSKNMIRQEIAKAWDTKLPKQRDLAIVEVVNKWKTIKDDGNIYNVIRRDKPVVQTAWVYYEEEMATIDRIYYWDEEENSPEPYSPTTDIRLAMKLADYWCLSLIKSSRIYAAGDTNGPDSCRVNPIAFSNSWCDVICKAAFIIVSERDAEEKNSPKDQQNG